MVGGDFIVNIRDALFFVLGHGGPYTILFGFGSFLGCGR